LDVFCRDEIEIPHGGIPVSISKRAGHEQATQKINPLGSAANHLTREPDWVSRGHA
jgi:hypothetical protein